MNTQLVFPLNIPTVRFTCSVAIEHWSSGCHNNRDVSCISFINQGFYFFLINIYLDSSQIALKYLKNTETNISNVIIMIGDFNIRDSL